MNASTSTRLIEAALLGTLAGGAGEAVRAVGEGGVAGALAAAGLWVGWLPGLALALVALVALARSAPVRAMVRDERRGPAWTEAAAVVAGWVALALALVGARLGELAIVVLRDLQLIGPVLRVGLIGAGLAAIAGGLLLVGPLARLLARVPPRRRWTLAALSLMLPLGLALADPAGALLKDISLAGPMLGGLALTAAVARLARRSPAPGWRVAALAMLLVGLGVGGLVVYDRDLDARVAVDEARGAARWVGVGLRRVADRDGDGVAAAFGGRDCDDTDPARSPAAIEIAGDGIDQDCDGIDPDPTAVEAERITFTPRPRAARKRWNLLWITIDAVRADRLELYGYGRETAPNIAALGAQGLVFERAYTPAGRTLYAIPAMFSGRPVGLMNVDHVGSQIVLSGDDEMIFDRLRAAGWHTIAHVGAALARYTWFGIEARFEDFRTHGDASSPDKGDVAEALTAGVIASIEAHQAALDPRPWAIWTHYYEPHAPYRPAPGSPFGVASHSDIYDGEINFVDREIGALWQALVDRGLEDETVIVITSDHGEAFGEHGQRYHGRQLYDESVRVPLVFFAHGLPHRRVAAPVSTLDAAETVAHLLGVQPGYAYGARTHLPLWLGQAEPEIDRRVFIDNLPHNDRPDRRLTAVVEWPWKYIVDVARGREQLYHLKTDAAEKRDLVRKYPEVTRALARAVREELASRQAADLRTLIARRVSDAVPEGAAPIEAAEGIEWLGGEARGENARLYTVTTRWRATGTRRPDYVVRVEWVDEDGEVRRKHDVRPLAGRHPTPRWRAGDVVTDEIRVGVRPGGRTLTGQVSLLVRDERVWGPTPVGSVAPIE